MTAVKVNYLSGDPLHLENCATVGSIMVQVAKLHERFAPDIAVVCLDKGKELTDPRSKVLSSAVTVVLHQAADPPAQENLCLALLLHAEYEDATTCARALEMLRRSYPWAVAEDILLSVMRDETRDAEEQCKILTTLVHAGVNGGAALVEAAGDGNKEAVGTFLSAGVPPNGEYRALNLSLGHDYSLLLGRSITALINASLNGRSDVVEILLSHGAQVNHSTENGHTALMHASMVGHNGLVEILLSHGAEVNRADGDRCTALMWASLRGCAEVVEILRAHGAELLCR